MFFHCLTKQGLFGDTHIQVIYAFPPKVRLNQTTLLLDEEGHPSLFAPIMIATLSTCAQLERDNISFRLQSGRKRYIEKGGKLGRKVGSVKTAEQMKAEYREVISLLRKGYSIRDVAKLSGKGVSTVQRVKRLLKVQSTQ